MPVSPHYRASTSHAALGPEFYDVVAAAEFPDHILRYRNQRAAKTVGLDMLSDEEWIAHFGRFQPLAENFKEPLALRYHGHQFRTYNPELGDGRGFLFAQLYDDKGRLLDLATKGSGKTPWSRTADGRLTLKGGVREVLATAMLEALGVDTSKTFSLIETGEALVRGDEPSPTRSSVMVRLSHSHIRIGSFQRQAFLRSTENIQKLLDYTIRTYMPEVWRDDVAARAIAFLEEVCRRVARVGAQWMAAGFVHGVLNTDNINVTGESFDYGPWRFLPFLEPAFTAAYFDETGLYAYGRQPDALFWNVTRLAECLLGLADQPSLEKALGVFEPAIRQEFTDAMLRRLGVQPRDAVSDNELVRALWIFLSETKAPFEQTFFDWFGGLKSAERAANSPSKDHYVNTAFAAVRDALKDFVPREGVDLNQAFFSRPVACSMLIEEVEAIWKPIADNDDWSVFHAKLQAIDEMREAYGLG
ncbi:MAG TPA: YdiU family protein [Afipia sp.]|uniref:protein adenylyltransferase SelO n=1 Tax=unclassified Afipia TaxID=2642050 RepID=UPI000466252F|nr:MULTISPECIES: YdiU family protein [unclassified Afipia]MAH72080.1 SELO family protein [Afipia sp.]OUX58697.1 MAG: SELO family protein [Afipia sp. TMED4]HAP10951.1 YdiU family protein [Afipia sp.]HAP49415.1 YdiU family protein [Afipia sp.]HBR45068.1 YdiU family protein [Afipia sp.]